MGVKINRGFIAIILLSLLGTSIFAAEKPKPQPSPTAVSADKKVIFYVFEDSKGLYQIGAMNTEGGAKAVLTSKGNNWCPAVSNDGARVAFFSDRSGVANLWVMNSDGTSQQAVTEDTEPINRIDLYNRGQLAWVKEKRELFFLSRRDLWKIDENGSAPSAYTNTHDITMFRISPDHSRIIFAREKTAKNNGLWIMEIDGTGTKQIYESSIPYPAFDWGERDLVAFYAGNFVNSMQASGIMKKAHVLAIYPDNDIAWAIQPDGKPGSIAYIAPGEAGPEIWTLNRDTNEKKKVTDRGGLGPCWMDDAQTLFYVQGFDIYRVNTQTMQKKRLTYHFSSYYPVFAVIKNQAAAAEEIKAK
jgi:Tol biopolymer transport system component